VWSLVSSLLFSSRLVSSRLVSSRLVSSLACLFSLFLSSSLLSPLDDVLFVFTGDAAFNAKLDTILETQQQFSRFVISGTLSARIIISTEIPKSLLDSSIHGSNVGGSGDLGITTTLFVKNQLLCFTNEEWETPDLPADVVDIPKDMQVSKLKRELAYLQTAVGKFGLIDVNNDNQFNIKVDIQDAAKHVVHLSARVDYLIVPSDNINKDMPVVDILRYTIVFVKVASGGKSLELAGLQLMTSLLAVAHFIGHRQLYGIVVSADLDTAQIIKYDHHGCFTDGTFHPSKLETIVSMLLDRTIM
jgi:hypothetical protein